MPSNDATHSECICLHCCSFCYNASMKLIEAIRVVNDINFEFDKETSALSEEDSVCSAAATEALQVRPAKGPRQLAAFLFQFAFLHNYFPLTSRFMASSHLGAHSLDMQSRFLCVCMHFSMAIMVRCKGQRTKTKGKVVISSSPPARSLWMLQSLWPASLP